MIAAETYLDLLSDPAHWAFEITLMLLLDGLLLGLAWPIVKRLVRKHDAQHHDIVKHGKTYSPEQYTLHQQAKAILDTMYITSVEEQFDQTTGRSLVVEAVGNVIIDDTYYRSH